MSLVRVCALLACIALSSCGHGEADYVRFATEQLRTGAGCCEDADHKECPDTAPERCPFLRDPVVTATHAEPCCGGGGMRVSIELRGGACSYEVVKGPNGGFALGHARCAAR